MYSLSIWGGEMNSWFVLYMLVMSVLMYLHLRKLEKKIRKSTLLWGEASALQGCCIVVGTFALICLFVLADRYAYTIYNWGSV